jgi:hypothetical protein
MRISSLSGSLAVLRLIQGFSYALRELSGGSLAPIVQEDEAGLLVRHVMVNRHDVDTGSTQSFEHR